MSSRPRKNLTMLDTTEIRWFLRGSPPRLIEDWFGKLSPQPPHEEARVDYYLRPTDVAINVKVRQGLLEVKRCSGSEPDAVLAPRVEGAIEYWSKYSFRLAGDDIGRPADDWVSCRKIRKSVWFSAERDVMRSLAGPGENPAYCQVELSTIELEKQSWWSVALEAAGMNGNHLLRATAAHIFGLTAPTDFNADRCMGYAAWLSKHAPRRVRTQESS